MRTIVFSQRTMKEILRDPLNLMFGLGFPIVLLLLLSAIQANIPVDLFKIEVLAPGITIFGLSFISLMSATLISKDRESSFLQRLYTTPLRSIDFILGYMLPLIPISVMQSTICYLVSFALGLSITIEVLYAILMIIPISIFYISFGLFCGSVLNVKQVGGICGALLTNLSAWLSGIWFDLELVGGTFKKIADCLPFIHAVELEKIIVSGNYTQSLSHIIIVLIYSVLMLILSILMFLKQSKNK